MRDERNVRSADGKQQPISIGMLVDVPRQPLGCHDEGVIGMTDEMRDHPKIQANAEGNCCQSGDSHPAALVQQACSSNAHDKDEREGDDLVVTRLHIVVPADEKDVSGGSQQRCDKKRVSPQPA